MVLPASIGYQICVCLSLSNGANFLPFLAIQSYAVKTFLSTQLSEILIQNTSLDLTVERVKPIQVLANYLVVCFAVIVVFYSSPEYSVVQWIL